MSEKIRTPQRKNSIQTREKIVQAAIELFVDQGYHQTNSNEIAKKAGVAVGSFYAYYRDKKDLLMEIVKGHLERVEQELFPADPAELTVFEDPKSLVYVIIQKTFASFEMELPLHRLIDSLRFSVPEIQTLFEEHEERSLRMTVGLLSAFQPHLSVKNVEVAAAMVGMAIETVVEYARTGLDGGEEKIYLQELADMVYKYLFT